MTLTQTLAWRRSGVVSTFVIVANPIRGSATSASHDRPDLLPQQLVDPIRSRSRHRCLAARKGVREGATEYERTPRCVSDGTAQRTTGVHGVGQPHC